MRRALCLLMAAGLCACHALAGSIVRDGTVGPMGPLEGPEFMIPDTDGQTRGNNLFHSFSRFDLDQGDSATFTGPENILNILARVTGGAASMIDGTIDTTSMPSANFFFINPFGVIFGQNAQVNVSGSFAVTTADYVKLDDGNGNVGRFDARNPANDILTTAPVSAFGFLGPAVAPITLTGPTPEPGDDSAALTFVPDGKSIWLVGGDIHFETYLLGAFGGEIVLVSVASAGELAVNVDELNTDVNTTSFAALGNLTLANRAFLFASGDPPGRLLLEANRVIVDDSLLLADNFGDNTGSGGIALRARSGIELMGRSTVSAGVFAGGDGVDIDITAPSILFNTVTVLAGAVQDTTGNSGNVRITAEEFAFTGGGQIAVSSGPVGAGGDLVLTADRVRLEGSVEVLADGRVRRTSPQLAGQSFGGPAGTIIVNADTVELLTGGQIRTDSTAEGFPGGDITVTARTLILDDQRGVGLTQISSRSVDTGSGGGNIFLNVDHIAVRNGAQISTATFTDGPAGNIVIQGKDVVVEGQGVRVVGRDEVIVPSAISSASERGNGTAGSVTLLLTGSLLVRDGGALSVSADRTAGGDVTVNAGNSIRLINGQITAQAFGDGGNVRLTAPRLVYLLNSQISAESVTGNGGNVTIDPQFVILNNSLITANAIVGNGGNIFIVSDFFLSSGSAVTASSEFGLQGSVTIAAPDVDLSGSLLPLSGELLDAEEQLRPACAVKLPGGLSSFVVLGRGGVPIEPDGLLPAFPRGVDEN